MNTQEQLARLDHWLATNRLPWSDPNPTPRVLEDPETLARSRVRPIPAHATYRRNVDHPREPWRDDLAVATGDYRDDWSAA